MSFLAPLYALAALAIAAPILLHLVRKQPKEHMEFSSLLFLEPAPPRLTRKSRIDHWMVLLLRVAILGLLALAFARPYWNAAIDISGGASAGVRRIVLVDQSASMQREGVWDAALEMARTAIANASPNDTLAVYGYATQLQPSLPLITAAELPVSQRAQSAVQALQSLRPTWGESRLGAALVECVDLLQADESRSDETAPPPSEIVVVSDLQGTSELESLSRLDWPEDVLVRVLRVPGGGTGNAYLAFPKQDSDAIGASASDSLKGSPRERGWYVRVTNTAGAAQENFRLRWIDAEGKPIDDTETECRVAAGAHALIRLPYPPPGAVAVELLGDRCTFDNRRFLVQDPPRNLKVLCVEKSLDQPEESLWYFLERMPLDAPAYSVELQRVSPDSEWPQVSPTEMPWVILSHHASLADADRCLGHLKAGGHAMLVLDAPCNRSSADGTSLESHCLQLTERCAEVALGSIGEAPVKQFALMTRPNFTHPSFAPLADSRFNDFSKMRFWRHRDIALADPDAWDVLAWFDSGVPAILERRVGAGTLVVLAAGWQPVESQWALSSKFVPWISGMFSQSVPGDRNRTEWVTGQPGAAEVPGIYDAVDASGSPTRIAANMSVSESELQPMDLAELSRFGVRLQSEAKVTSSAVDSKRQMMAAELEARQSGWWWLLSVALGVVGLESVLCSWRRRQASNAGTD